MSINWIATPEVWWVQWPFLGWGIGVVAHALVVFGTAPTFISNWRLRKIKEVQGPDVSAAQPSAQRVRLNAAQGGHGAGGSIRWAWGLSTTPRHPIPPRSALSD